MNKENPSISSLRRFVRALESPIALCLPTLIFIIGIYSERAKINQEYVRLAIAVLQTPNKKEMPQKELREWAVKILQKTSPVKLSEEAADLLINGKSNLPQAKYVYDVGLKNPQVYDAGLNYDTIDSPRSK